MILDNILTIFVSILGPLMVMIGVGALLHWKFRLDIPTLAKLNIYLLCPAFVFDRISTSRLEWSAMGGIVGATVIQVFVLGLLVAGIGLMFRVRRETIATIALSVMFYNSGNYGIPLAELAYPNQGAVEVQTFVLTTQNLLNFTIGLTIAAWAGSGYLGKSILHVFRTPILPMLACGLLARWWTGGNPEVLPPILTKSAGYLGDGLVPMALITLGAQLANRPRWPRWRPVSLVVVLRLVFAPLLMAGMLFGFHLLGIPGLSMWPRPAEFIILTAGTPTAVNTLLLVLEMGGDAELSADCVFWTTVLSLFSFTVSLVLLAMFMSPTGGGI